MHHQIVVPKDRKNPLDLFLHETLQQLRSQQIREINVVYGARNQIMVLIENRRRGGKSNSTDTIIKTLIGPNRHSVFSPKHASRTLGSSVYITKKKFQPTEHFTWDM